MHSRVIRSMQSPSLIVGILAWAALGALASAGPVHAQEETPTVVPASGPSIKLEGLVQLQGSSSTVDSVVNWDIELRRARVTLDGEGGGGFSGRLMADFDSNRARIRDAYIDAALGKAAKIRVGQFKIPFNAVDIESAKRLLLIERGNRIRGFGERSVSNFLADAHYSARNRGIMAIASSGRFSIQAGAWLGSGEANENDDGKEFGGRVDYRVLPRENGGIPLVVGAAFMTNGFYGPPRDTLRVVEGDTFQVDDAIYGKAVEVMAELGAYGRPGLHVLASFFAGDNPFALEVEGGEVELASFRAWQGWAEYRIETGGSVLTAIAPAARLDRFDPDTDQDDDANLFATFGLNLYFGKAFKIQANWERLDPEGDVDAESALRLQSMVLF